MKKEAIIGLLLVVLGLGLFAYYDHFVKPENAAQKLLDEGKGIFERGTGSAVNESINLFNRVIAQYPGTSASREAYFYMAQSYEKMGLNRLAYLKYIYILKTDNGLTESQRSEVKTRIAKLTVMKQLTEEGVYQMLTMLNNSTDREFRSRVYTELGHTYLKQGQYRNALRMFDVALTENGSNEEALLGKARSFKRLGESDKAYDLYDYFLKYYGDFSLFSKDVRGGYYEQLYDSGYASFKKGQYWQAISFFKRLIRAFPGYKRTENAMYWIGESYFNLKQYESAISYFDRAMQNGFTDKDEASCIKKGYSYFMAKRYDLAAREFQRYIKDYPNGRHIETAKKWKEMSTKEILYRIKDKTAPEEGEDLRDSEDELKENGKDSGGGDLSGKNVKGSVNEVVNTEKDGRESLENMAEI
jgi:TolA-binding protein